MSNSSNSSPIPPNNVTENKDLSIFNLFYLYQFGYLNLENTHICSFAHLGDMQKIVSLFKENKEENLLKIPGCQNANIYELRQLSLDFANSEINQKFFDEFEKKLSVYDEIIATRTNPDYNSEIKRKESQRRLADFKNKYDLSGIKNYNLNALLSNMRIPKHIATMVLNLRGIAPLKELLEIYIYNPVDLLKYRNVGMKTYYAWVDVCTEIIKTLPIKPDYNTKN